MAYMLQQGRREPDGERQEGRKVRNRYKQRDMAYIYINERSCKEGESKRKNEADK